MTLFENQTVDPHQLPKLEAEPRQALEKSYLMVSLLGRSIFLFFLLIPTFVLGMVGVPRWVLASVFIAWLLLSGWTILSTLKGFKFKQYSLREHDINYYQGWLWKRITSIPFIRIQHCEVHQGMLERAWGLASLKVYTAGGSSSDLNIPGLLPDRANALKDFILQKTAADGDNQ